MFTYQCSDTAVKTVCGVCLYVLHLLLRRIRVMITLITS